VGDGICVHRVVLGRRLLLDGVQGSPGAWSTRYFGIFAPHSDDYRFTGLDRSQWWSGMAPTQGDETDVYDRKLGRRNIYCEQHIDGGNVPVSVPINIWSMQCLANEGRVKELPLTAEVRYDRERSEWAVTVENTAETPISASYALVGRDHCVDLGAVPARQIRQFRGRAKPWRPWRAHVRRLRDYEYGAERMGEDATRVVGKTAFLACGSLRRTEAIRRYLRDGAVVVCAEYEGAPVPHDIVDRRCEFDHKQLARLVVFPEGRK
jgi:hypothetical protein